MHLFPKRREGTEARPEIHSMSLTAAHLRTRPGRYIHAQVDDVRASGASHDCLLPRGGPSATGMRTSTLTTPCGQGVLRSGLKKLGDSKAALGALRSKAETDRSKKVVCAWYRYRDAGWVKCQRAVACPLHLHPALALRLSCLASAADLGALGLSLAHLHRYVTTTAQYKMSGGSVT